MQRSTVLLNRLLSTQYSRFSVAKQLSTESSSSKGSSIKISDKPIAEVHTKEELLVPVKPVPLSTQVDFKDDVIAVSELPEEHVYNRRARIFIPARAATQSGWNNTTHWKIELDNRERWENPLMGWCSTGDPLSNISMALDFASKEDAIRYCVRQGWEYEVEEPQHMKIKPKAYGSNYAWNKKTKIWTK